MTDQEPPSTPGLGLRRALKPIPSLPLALILHVLLSLSHTAAVTENAGSWTVCADITLAIGSYIGGDGVSLLSLSLSRDLTIPEEPPYGTLEYTGVVKTEVSGENPSYCALPSTLPDYPNPSNTALYCVNQVEDGGVAAISVSCNTALYGPTDSPKPTHIAALSGGSSVLTANYAGSTVSSLLVSPSDGSLKIADVFEVPAELASNTEPTGRQEEPHPHMVLEVAPGLVAVPDLGSDLVWLLSVDEYGMLAEEGRVAMAKGDGPRHAAQHSFDGTATIYVVTEFSLMLVELREGCGDEGVAGVLGECGRTALLPEEGDFSTAKLEGSSAAAVRVSQDGKFVYASVRRASDEEGEGAIVGFALGPSGTVSDRVGVWGSGGQHPRDFNLVEAGPGYHECGAGASLLVVANRDSDTVDVFLRDEVSGVMGVKIAQAAVSQATSVLKISNTVL